MVGGCERWEGASGERAWSCLTCAGCPCMPQMDHMDEMDFNFSLGFDEVAPEEQTLMTILVAKGLVSSETSFGKSQDEKDRGTPCA